MDINPARPLPGWGKFKLLKMSTEPEYAYQYRARFSKEVVKPPVIGFKQAIPGNSSDVEKRGKRRERALARLISTLRTDIVRNVSNRKKPIEIFASCVKCTLHDGVFSLIKQAVESNKAQVRYLFSEDAIKRGSGKKIQQLASTGKLKGRVKCRMTPNDGFGRRLFGVYDPEFPEMSHVSWLVVPSVYMDLSLFGEEVVLGRRKLFDVIWKTGKPCPLLK